MDASELIIEYSADDFANAIRLLLPRGNYWQDVTSVELSNLIYGMAMDFKITHDEVQLALLTDFNKPLFGWKLSDYRRLMAEFSIEGAVTDSVSVPNLITVSLDPAQSYKAMFAAFEKERLPHTKFHWVLKPKVNGHVVRFAGYQQQIYALEVGPKPLPMEITINAPCDIAVISRVESDAIVEVSE